MGSFNFQYFPPQKGTVRRIAMASSLLKFSCMGWICQHCGAPFVDSAYRVKSEESGIVLLDLIVCHGCYVQARELGLRTEEIGVRYRSPAEITAAQEKKPTLRR
jgi:1-acyl-sn-glycerol-3-phosphate acyltransferase